MFSRSLVAILRFCFVLLLSCVCAVAQSQTAGNISGVVTDANGAVIAGAEVMVSSRATGDERRVMTGDDGTYTVSLLPPGTYRVQITANGFRQVVYEDVTVAITETTAIPVELLVGGLSASKSLSAIRRDLSCRANRRSLGASLIRAPSPNCRLQPETLRRF